jgi:methionyl aminopeptidase
MVAGIKAVRPGATLGDIGAAIQQVAESAGFSVVKEYCGHGVGQEYHAEPQILHYGRPGTGLVLKKGMIFTIEPMINAGKAATSVLSDGGRWSPKTVLSRRSGSIWWRLPTAVSIC